MQDGGPRHTVFVIQVDDIRFKKLQQISSVKTVQNIKYNILTNAALRGRARAKAAATRTDSMLS